MYARSCVSSAPRAPAPEPVSAAPSAADAQPGRAPPATKSENANLNWTYTATALRDRTAPSVFAALDRAFRIIRATS